MRRGWEMEYDLLLVQSRAGFCFHTRYFGDVSSSEKSNQNTAAEQKAPPVQMGRWCVRRNLLGWVFLQPQHSLPGSSVTQTVTSLSFGARKPCIHPNPNSQAHWPEKTKQSKTSKTRFHFFVCPYLFKNARLFLSIRDSALVMYIVCFYFTDWSAFLCNIFNIPVD